MSETSILMRRPNEGAEDYLMRLGTLKDAGLIEQTWPQLTFILNSQIPNLARPLAESTWRKKYQQLCSENNYSCEMNDIEDVVQEYDAASNENKDYSEATTIVDEEAFEADKMIVRLRDERHALNRIVRAEARQDALLDLFASAISKYRKPSSASQTVVAGTMDEGNAVYALLSDIHYGISFNNGVGKYNSDVAKQRVMDYANRILEIGKRNNAKACYVSLLGDLISGIIHAPIRIENRENAVEQVVGVSELVALFLFMLAQQFETVYVNSVSGNHSRIDLAADNSLRSEKLDSLVIWYCKAKLDNIENVKFFENTIDPTVCSFAINGKNYIGVHGDYDKDLAKSAISIERLTRKPVDYMLSGHLHTANMLVQDRTYIRNGSVCGSGDDYTARNRLFSNPHQLCLVINKEGDVSSVNIVNL